jgi:hypothetical protein
MRPNFNDILPATSSNPCPQHSHLSPNLLHNPHAKNLEESKTTSDLFDLMRYAKIHDYLSTLCAAPNH